MGIFGQPPAPPVPRPYRRWRRLSRDLSKPASTLGPFQSSSAWAGLALHHWRHAPIPPASRPWRTTVSAQTRSANAVTRLLASSRLSPYTIAPGSSTTSAIQRPSSSRSVSIVNRICLVGSVRRETLATPRTVTGFRPAREEGRSGAPFGTSSARRERPTADYRAASRRLSPRTSPLRAAVSAITEVPRLLRSVPRAVHVVQRLLRRNLITGRSHPPTLA